MIETEIWNKNTFGLVVLTTALLSQKDWHKDKKLQTDELKCIATFQAGNDEKSWTFFLQYNLCSTSFYA